MSVVQAHASSMASWGRRTHTHEGSFTLRTHTQQQLVLPGDGCVPETLLLGCLHTSCAMFWAWRTKPKLRLTGQQTHLTPCTKGYTHGQDTRGSKKNSRCGDVVEHQKQAVGLGVAPPVVASPHRRVDRFIDDGFTVEVCHHELSINERTAVE